MQCSAQAFTMQCLQCLHFIETDASCVAMHEGPRNESDDLASVLDNTVDAQDVITGKYAGHVLGQVVVARAVAATGCVWGTCNIHSKMRAAFSMPKYCTHRVACGDILWEVLIYHDTTNNKCAIIIVTMNMDG